jgi:hypothetical protein
MADEIDTGNKESGGTVEVEATPAPESQYVSQDPSETREPEGPLGAGNRAEKDQQEIKVPDGKEQDGKAGETSSAISPYLLERAQALGLTAEEALEHGSSAGLERTLRYLERTASKQEKKPEAETEKEFRLALEDDEDVHESIRKGITEYREHTQKEIAAMKAEHKQVMDHYQKEQERKVEETVDKLFGELPEEYRDLFGTGPVRKMDRNSPQRANVQKVLHAMSAIYQLDEQNGREPVSEKELHQRAISYAFGDQTKTLARKEVEASLQKRSRLHVSRPSQRDASELVSREDKALAHIKAVRERAAKR